MKKVKNQYKVLNSTGKEIFPFMATHPGSVLADELKARRISIKSFAVQLNITTTQLQAVINGKKSITKALAVQLYAALNIEAGFWLRMQKSYDLDKKIITKPKIKSYDKKGKRRI